MPTSVHIADVGIGAALRSLVGGARLSGVAGLRHADLAAAAPLSASLAPAPQVRRIALIAFWDDDAAIDAFVADHPLAAKLAGGWSVRLEPLRAFGTWLGLSPDVPRARKVPHDGPAVVLTLGRVKIPQVPRFLRTSAKAEASAAESPGMIWGTALARPPFVATCSLWESSEALSTYAYGPTEEPHPHAIAADRDKPFHHRSAFIRFRPYRAEGHLDGRNALPESALQAAGRP